MAFEPEEEPFFDKAVFKNKKKIPKMQTSIFSLDSNNVHSSNYQIPDVNDKPPILQKLSSKEEKNTNVFALHDPRVYIEMSKKQRSTFKTDDADASNINQMGLESNNSKKNVAVNHPTHILRSFKNAEIAYNSTKLLQKKNDSSGSGSEIDTYSDNSSRKSSPTAVSRINDYSKAQRKEYTSLLKNMNSKDEASFRIKKASDKKEKGVSLYPKISHSSIGQLVSESDATSLDFDHPFGDTPKHSSNSEVSYINDSNLSDEESTFTDDDSEEEIEELSDMQEMSNLSQQKIEVTQNVSSNSEINNNADTEAQVIVKETKIVDTIETEHDGSRSKSQENDIVPMNSEHTKINQNNDAKTDILNKTLLSSVIEATDKSRDCTTGAVEQDTITKETEQPNTTNENGHVLKSLEQTLPERSETGDSKSRSDKPDVINKASPTMQSELSKLGPKAQLENCNVDNHSSECESSLSMQCNSSLNSTSDSLLFSDLFFESPFFEYILGQQMLQETLPRAKLKVTFDENIKKQEYRLAPERSVKPKPSNIQGAIHDLNNKLLSPYKKLSKNLISHAKSLAIAGQQFKLERCEFKSPLHELESKNNMKIDTSGIKRDRIPAIDTFSISPEDSMDTTNSKDIENEFKSANKFMPASNSARTDLNIKHYSAYTPSKHNAFQQVSSPSTKRNTLNEIQNKNFHSNGQLKNYYFNGDRNHPQRLRLEPFNQPLVLSKANGLSRINARTNHPVYDNVKSAFNKGAYCEVLPSKNVIYQPKQCFGIQNNISTIRPYIKLPYQPMHTKNDIGVPCPSSKSDRLNREDSLYQESLPPNSQQNFFQSAKAAMIRYPAMLGPAYTKTPPPLKGSLDINASQIKIPQRFTYAQRAPLIVNSHDLMHTRSLLPISSYNQIVIPGTKSNLQRLQTYNDRNSSLIALPTPKNAKSSLIPYTQPQLSQRYSAAENLNSVRYANNGPPPIKFMKAPNTRKTLGVPRKQILHAHSQKSNAAKIGISNAQIEAVPNDFYVPTSYSLNSPLTEGAIYSNQTLFHPSFFLNDDSVAENVKPTTKRLKALPLTQCGNLNYIRSASARNLSSDSVSARLKSPSDSRKYIKKSNSVVCNEAGKATKLSPDSIAIPKLPIPCRKLKLDINAEAASGADFTRMGGRYQIQDGQSDDTSSFKPSIIPYNKSSLQRYASQPILPPTPITSPHSIKRITRTVSDSTKFALQLVQKSNSMGYNKAKIQRQSSYVFDPNNKKHNNNLVARKNLLMVKPCKSDYNNRIFEVPYGGNNDKPKRFQSLPLFKCQRDTSPINISARSRISSNEAAFLSDSEDDSIKGFLDNSFSIELSMSLDNGGQDEKLMKNSNDLENAEFNQHQNLISLQSQSSNHNLNSDTNASDVNGNLNRTREQSALYVIPGLPSKNFINTSPTQVFDKPLMQQKQFQNTKSIIFNRYSQKTLKNGQNFHKAFKLQNKKGSIASKKSRNNYLMQPAVILSDVNAHLIQPSIVPLTSSSNSQKLNHGFALNSALNKTSIDLVPSPSPLRPTDFASVQPSVASTLSIFNAQTNPTVASLDLTSSAFSQPSAINSIVPSCNSSQKHIFSLFPSRKSSTRYSKLVCQNQAGNNDKVLMDADADWARRLCQYTQYNQPPLENSANTHSELHAETPSNTSDTLKGTLPNSYGNNASSNIPDTVFLQKGLANNSNVIPTTQLKSPGKSISIHNYENDIINANNENQNKQSQNLYDTSNTLNPSQNVIACKQDQRKRNAQYEFSEISHIDLTSVSYPGSVSSSRSVSPAYRYDKNYTNGQLIESFPDSNLKKSNEAQLQESSTKSSQSAISHQPLLNEEFYTSQKQLSPLLKSATSDVSTNARNNHDLNLCDFQTDISQANLSSAQQLSAPQHDEMGTWDSCNTLQDTIEINDASHVYTQTLDFQMGKIYPDTETPIRTIDLTLGQLYGTPRGFSQINTKLSDAGQEKTFSDLINLNHGISDTSVQSNTHVNADITTQSSENQKSKSHELGKDQTYAMPFLMSGSKNKYISQNFRNDEASLADTSSPSSCISESKKFRPNSFVLNDDSVYLLKPFKEMAVETIHDEKQFDSFGPSPSRARGSSCNSTATFTSANSHNTSNISSNCQKTDTSYSYLLGMMPTSDQHSTNNNFLNNLSIGKQDYTGSDNQELSEQEGKSVQRRLNTFERNRLIRRNSNTSDSDKSRNDVQWNSFINEMNDLKKSVLGAELKLQDSISTVKELTEKVCTGVNQGLNSDVVLQKLSKRVKRISTASKIIADSAKNAEILNSKKRKTLKKTRKVENLSNSSRLDSVLSSVVQPNGDVKENLDLPSASDLKNNNSETTLSVDNNSDLKVDSGKENIASIDDNNTLVMEKNFAAQGLISTKDNSVPNEKLLTQNNDDCCQENSVNINEKSIGYGNVSTNGTSTSISKSPIIDSAIKNNTETEHTKSVDDQHQGSKNVGFECKEGGSGGKTDEFTKNDSRISSSSTSTTQSGFLFYETATDKALNGMGVETQDCGNQSTLNESQNSSNPTCGDGSSPETDATLQIPNVEKYNDTPSIIDPVNIGNSNKDGLNGTATDAENIKHKHRDTTYDSENSQYSISDSITEIEDTYEINNIVAMAAANVAESVQKELSYLPSSASTLNGGSVNGILSKNENELTPNDTVEKNQHTSPITMQVDENSGTNKTSNREENVKVPLLNLSNIKNSELNEKTKKKCEDHVNFSSNSTDNMELDSKAKQDIQKDVELEKAASELEQQFLDFNNLPNSNRMRYAKDIDALYNSQIPQDSSTNLMASIGSTSSNKTMQRYASRGSRNPRCRALCIGISYQETKLPLHGTVNDCLQWEKLLKTQFHFQDIRIVVDIPTDGQSIYQELPTKQCILENLTWLVDDSQAGDILFFLYSGRCCLIDDGGSLGFMESALVPLDYEKLDHDEYPRLIYSDEIHSILANINDGVQLCAILDTCYTSTIVPLHVTLDSTEKKEGKRKINLEKPRKTFLNATRNKRQNKVSKSLDTIKVNRKSNFTNFFVDPLWVNNERIGEVGPALFVFSACKNEQEAVEINYNGAYEGLLSRCLFEAASVTQLTYGSVFTLANQIREFLMQDLCLDHVDQAFQLSYVELHPPHSISFLSHAVPKPPLNYSLKDMDSSRKLSQTIDNTLLIKITQCTVDLSYLSDDMFFLSISYHPADYSKSSFIRSRSRLPTHNFLNPEFHDIPFDDVFEIPIRGRRKIMAELIGDHSQPGTHSARAILSVKQHETHEQHETAILRNMEGRKCGKLYYCLSSIRTVSHSKLQSFEK